MSAPLIEGQLRRTLKKLILDGAPSEVGGLIVDGEYVHMMDNYADNPSDSFQFRGDELTQALMSYGFESREEVQDRVVLWHSHPSGGVGPSSTDMRQKTKLSHHLVVAIVDGDIVPTWY
jgi:proteasome lid subunit RPN8/RPN11